jgi:hypothetical protein
MDIQSLRKMRSNDFSKIIGEFEKLSTGATGGKSYEDARFWTPTVDKGGNGSALLRFLPRAEGDEFPWVRIYSHSFQGPTGKWYIENSLSTVGENDPVGELNSRLWNSGSEENKKIASKQKRKTSYIANILVINDPAKPENNGKVFLFKFGKKIFDKIMDKARPTFEDEKPVLVFDLWEGANFKLRIRNVEGYRNYDKSEFESETPLLDGDEEKLVSLINTQHKLAEFLDREKNFKSYDALKKRLDEVLSGAGAVTKSAAKIAEDEDDLSSLAAPASRSVEAPAAKAKAAPIEDDDDDALSYFQKMAQE